MNNLSPAAQAIVSAFNERYELCGPFDVNWDELCLAATLRAAAAKLSYWHVSGITDRIIDEDELLDIANELEAHA